MDDDEIATSQDVAALWTRLRRARAEGDDATEAAIRRRMAEVQLQRRYADLGDADLDRRIAALVAARTPEAITHAGDSNDAVTNRHYAEINRRMAEAARSGDRSDLDDLLAERERRRERA